jgi:hypothetical protein
MIPGVLLSSPDSCMLLPANAVQRMQVRCQISMEQLGIASFKSMALHQLKKVVRRDTGKFYAVNASVRSNPPFFKELPSPAHTDPLGAPDSE